MLVVHIVDNEDWSCRDNGGGQHDSLFLGFVTQASLRLTLRVAEGVEDAYGVCVNVSVPPGFRYSSNVGFDSCVTSSTTLCCLNAPIASGEDVSGGRGLIPVARCRVMQRLPSCRSLSAWSSLFRPAACPFFRE